ncbi:transferrin receptor protein 1 isoform X2 [Mixophyes fleayi]|uniref:transferrin receptor protein 1 isoform X2 n=1 Tax=Mixophyes fleayi TaxID=3061075 RepID=UPI003F4DD812
MSRVRRPLSHCRRREGSYQVLMKMERARSAVTNFFGRVPLTYTRFSLTPQTDGDASQVEMKLADEEECGDQTLGDHIVKHKEGNNGCRSLCFKILGAFLLFLIGFLIGYLIYRGREPCPSTPVEHDPQDESEAEMFSDSEMPNILYWSDLKTMLDRKIDNLFFETTIENLSVTSREAGSDKEDAVATMVRDAFTKMSLNKVWNDEHYVTLQDQGRSNTVTVLKADGLVDETFTPASYVAYSHADSVTAGLVYAHYGRMEDFDALRVKNIDVIGKLVLVRSGLIVFSEKVKNAEIANAAGVLIYPDPSDFTFPNGVDKDIDSPFGHAHFGTGDPFTPGFPSFNHTQFPPSRSSGLPQIPVQSLSSRHGKRLLGKLDMDGCPDSWRNGCRLGKAYKNITLEVTNTMAEKKIYNIFGVIKGFDEPDRYVVIGAQRDSWGLGVAKAVVGSSVLVELARVLSEMVKMDGYRPRRSIVFASWSAGDFGSVGATEWLEGYLTSLHLKAISYINLDAVVQGSGSFQMSASPLMYNLIEKIMKEIADPTETDKNLYEQFNPAGNCLNCFSMDDAAYPFLAYSGIPSVSFSFRKDKKPYAYLGTAEDTFVNFKKLVAVDSMCKTAVKFAALITLRLTHDHILQLDYTKYGAELLQIISDLDNQRMAIPTMDLNLRWIKSARGDFNRAAESLKKSFKESDLDDKPLLRALNDRIMKVEYSMLSPYVSPKETPFRHILYGFGNHTVSAFEKHLSLLKTNASLFNESVFKNQLALLTWTLQGAANALTGDIWEIDNEF